MPLPGYGLHAKDEPIHGAEAEVATGRKLRLAALGGDAAAALGASLVVSPFILAVDKAIVQNAAGSDSLLGSLRKTAAETLLRPVALLRRPELYFIWGVYSATYFAANAIDTVCESRGADPAMPKFLGATCGTSLTPTLDCARRKGKCGGLKDAHLPAELPTGTGATCHRRYLPLGGPPPWSCIYRRGGAPRAIESARWLGMPTYGTTTELCHYVPAGLARPMVESRTLLSAPFRRGTSHA